MVCNHIGVSVADLVVALAVDQWRYRRRSTSLALAKWRKNPPKIDSIWKKLTDFACVCNNLANGYKCCSTESAFFFSYFSGNADSVHTTTYKVKDVFKTCMGIQVLKKSFYKIPSEIHLICLKYLRKNISNKLLNT